MRDIEFLKKEQQETKKKLMELVELINSEEYYALSAVEKGLITQQRMGLELYLSSLTKQLYSKDDSNDTSNILWLSMLYSMLGSSSGFGLSNTSYNAKNLEEKDFETKETDESGCSN